MSRVPDQPKSIIPWWCRRWNLFLVTSLKNTGQIPAPEFTFRRRLYVCHYSAKFTFQQFDEIDLRRTWYGDTYFRQFDEITISAHDPATFHSISLKFLIEIQIPRPSSKYTLFTPQKFQNWGLSRKTPKFSVFESLFTYETRSEYFRQRFAQPRRAIHCRNF